MSCDACPFACTDQSEYVQNLGCLPSAFDIIQMKKATGHNWACHESDPQKLKLCAGQVQWVKEMDVPVEMKTGGLISYETWFHKGEAAALEEASRRVAGPSL